MGDLLRQIKTERVSSGGKVHQVNQILNNLTEEDRVDLLKALKDESISASAISAVLTRNGHKVRPERISSWRRSHGTR